MDALARAGYAVELASTLRSYVPDGDAGRQAELRDQGNRIADELVARWSALPPDQRPGLWFTYHVYYKAPDWIGPRVAAELGIPYVIAEASYAPKRAGGTWALGHVTTGNAVRSAALVLCPTQDDVACLLPLVSGSDRIVALPPFLDPGPYQAAAQGRATHRAKMAADHDLDSGVPWIAVGAMMRPGDKKASYLMLADVLRKSADIPWRIVVAGDGAARAEIEAVFEAKVPGRAHFLGECGADALAAVFAACDLSVWPAVNEAYGMAMLEAQAAGLPIVSRAVRGVPDVVLDGRTGLLAPVDDVDTLARFTRELLVDASRREAMGRAAARFVAGERSVEAAAATLNRALRGIGIREPVKGAA